MRRTTLVATCLVAAMIGTGSVNAATPADLSTWQPASYVGGTIPLGQWAVSPGGDSVIQTVNGTPTFFVAPVTAAGQRITATFQAPLFDDDFFGFALGFSATDVTNTDADYLLVDWKQAAQEIDWFLGEGPVTASAGLAVSRVTGVPNFDELWAHVDQAETPDAAVTELARGATMGNAAWGDLGTQNFVVEYTTTRLRVWVNDVLELDLAGDFPDGPFALYNFSQPDITASAITFEPLNTTPEVNAAPDVSVNEGQVGSTSGSFVDPDGDVLTLVCVGNCGGFNDGGDGTWSWSALLPEGPASFDVTVTASDGLEEVSDTFTVTVANVAPVITATSSVPAASPSDTSVVVDADFVDAGVTDTHTATVNWGDGTVTPAAVNQGAGSGSLAGDHVYSTPGSYTITVTVTDDDGASDTAVLGQVFVFDPDTFVTGGGWVTSPEGAVAAEPTHTGKLTFGFVVRYDKNGQPSGNLQVQVHKQLKLHATGFDSLMIENGVAEFSGTAKVNGEPGYSFRVIATDERLAAAAEDRFWITVTGAGGVVYDGSLYPAGGLPIVGKGIQVHSR